MFLNRSNKSGIFCDLNQVNLNIQIFLCFPPCMKQTKLFEGPQQTSLVGIDSFKRCGGSPAGGAFSRRGESAEDGEGAVSEEGKLRSDIPHSWYVGALRVIPRVQIITKPHARSKALPGHVSIRSSLTLQRVFAPTVSRFCFDLVTILLLSRYFRMVDGLKCQRPDKEYQAVQFAAEAFTSRCKNAVEIISSCSYL